MARGIDTPTATDPNEARQSFSGASRMASSGSDASGDDQGITPGAGAEDPQQKLSNAVQVVRQAEESILALSQSFPGASEEVRKAREAIRAVLKKIVSNPGGQEPVAPRMGM